VKVSIGSHATAAALRAYGGVRRVAFMSPYFPTANAEVCRYLEEAGFIVVRDRCLQCPNWTDIATIPPETIRDTFRELDGDDVDAIVQVGTNLSAARLCVAAELWLGKPVIAINTAIYWHALRQAQRAIADAVGDDDRADIVGGGIDHAGPDRAAGGAAGDQQRIDAAEGQPGGEIGAEEGAGVFLPEDRLARGGRQFGDDLRQLAGFGQLQQCGHLHGEAPASDPSSA
jgi:hypothetical protein